MSSGDGVGVVFGGPSPEHDISILTGLQAARALHDDGAEVACLYWAKTGDWLRVPVTAEAADFLGPDIAGASPVSFSVPEGFAERRRRRSDPMALRVVLNCCHGGPGEDGSLAAMMMMAGIRITGPRPAAAALAMDKLATSAVAESLGIPTIETVLWSAESRPGESELPTPPWIVKPRWGGSSIDVEAGVEDLTTVEALASRGVGRAGMLIQPYLADWVDLNVAVRSHPQRQCSAVEKPLAGDAAILGYDQKYLAGAGGMEAAIRELPANIPDTVRAAVVDYSLKLTAAMDLTGAPRVDFLWDQNAEFVMCEVNPIPGAWGNFLWRECGVSRAQLYRDLLAEAEAAPVRLHQWMASSDGRALSMSDTIAAKLL